MYCGSCNSYIPGGLGISKCPDCGCSVEDSEKIKKEREEKIRLAEELKAEQFKESKITYNYFQAIYYSFFLPAFYQNAIKKWNGSRVFFFGVFVVALGLIPFTFGLHRPFIKYVNETIMPVVRDFPVITITNGTAGINKPSPYVVRNPKNGAILAILDMDGNYTDLTKSPGYFLLTKDQASFRESGNTADVRVVRLSPEINFVLTPDFLEYVVRESARWLPYIVFPIAWLVYVLGFMFIAFLYSIAAQILSFFFRAALPYAALFRMSLFAMTPVILIDGLASLWRVEGLPDFVSIPVPLIYLGVMIWLSRSGQKETQA